MKQEVVKLNKLPNYYQSLKVPEDVYVSSTGKYYYPELTTKAQIRIKLSQAESKGIKPSKAYIQFLEEQIKK